MSAGEASKKEGLPSTKDVVTTVFGAVKDYSRLASQIPSEDYEYHEAFPDFTKYVQEHSDTLIDVMDRCMQLLPARRRSSLRSTTNNASGLPALSEAQRAAAMEAIDSLLESVDSVLDEMKGRKLDANDQLAVTFGSELGRDLSGGDGTGGGSASSPGQRTGMGVRRPQLTFEHPVDNSEAPFVPVYHDAQGVRHVGTAHVHPFADAIKAFHPPASQLMPQTDTPYQPLATCPLRFVDTVVGLEDVVKELLPETEIAIDLEHHDFYSYQGFTCLMQISSRTVDYIIDCLQLRSSMHLLAPVFLNPKTLKVLHGAREDVRWLQKDFGLYLVNFFDTGIALQTLHMPYSLAFAVDHFCQVKLNKKYQTADWRVRPLPAEMVSYARQDTHYLLYIYDRLKSLLLNSEGRASIGNMLVHVFSESKALSLAIYEKPVLDPEQSYKHALGRSLGGLRAVQETVAKVVFNWRDAAAREVDDSPTAVMHLSTVLAIASKLPTSSRELLRCCSPVSVVLRQHVGQLLELVRSVVGTSDGGAAGGTDGDHSVQGGEADTVLGGVSAADATLSVLSRRPGGVYRPMTGALPSVGSLTYTIGDADLSTDRKRHREVAPADAAPVLRRIEPSGWLRAMKQLSNALARRPTVAVPLPGSDLLESIQSAAVAATRPADGESAAVPAVVNDESDDDQQTETQGGSVADALGTSDSPDFTALPKRSDAVQEEGAVALRDRYGTGAKNRRATRSHRGGASQKK